MRRILTISFAVAVGITMIVVVFLRQNRITTLKAERAQVLARLATPAEASPTVAPTDPPDFKQNSRSPSLELLKLRAEVARLGNRKRELVNDRIENERLYVQLTTQGTNVPGAAPLPVGYVRKAEAKFVGYDTPEDTLQSFFWAVQNRDAVRLFEAMSPENAESFQKTFQDDQSAARFFDDFNVMPGFHVMERNVEDENSVVLLVQTVPDQRDFSQKIKFTKIGSKWKLKDF